MRRIFLSVSFVVALALGANADDGTSVQIDETFTRANSWLDKQNLSLTGSQSEKDYTTPFEQDAILFYGEAVGNPDALTPAQRELGAKRAAEVIAQRSVAEYLKGFAMVGDTLVQDSMQQYDSIRSAVNGVIQGVQVVFKEYNPEKDTAIAIVKLGMHGPNGFASTMYEKMFKDRQFRKKLTEVDGRQAIRYRHKVGPLPERYDGLIVDATEQQFRPALINRIFSAKGELLYDPSKVSQQILVEQGCGEYANSVDMARNALASRGVKNPLVVKASGIMSSADLQVSSGDAVTIFSANQKANFFAAAKVAFVLK